MEALAKGLLPCAADISPPDFQYRRILLCRELGRAHNIALAESILQVILGATASSTPGSRAKRDYLNLAFKQVDAIRALRFPWVKSQDKDPMEGKISNLRAAWIRAFGDPNSPEVKARIAATAKFLRSHDRGIRGS